MLDIVPNLQAQQGICKEPWVLNCSVVDVTLLTDCTVVQPKPRVCSYTFPR